MPDHKQANVSLASIKSGKEKKWVITAWQREF